MKPEYVSFEEQMFFSTMRIEKPLKNSMGTGFLVTVPSCKENSNYVFLISNKHVLDDPSTETKLFFHLKDGSGNPLLGEVFNINLDNSKKAYYCSELPEVDLALINISELINFTKDKTGKEVNCRNIPLEMFSDYTEKDLVPNQKILFIGYPSDRYDKKNFLPILRGGIIASIPKIDFEGNPHVLVDAQVFPGSSGSPVFSFLGGVTKFIGVIVQTMIRNQKVEIIETAQQGITQEILGIGIIIKATEVTKLINKAKKELDEKIIRENSVN